MHGVGDRHLRWRREPRFVADYVGAATWQQKGTLVVALLGGATCAYLMIHVLGLDVRIPGLPPSPRIAAAAPAPPASPPHAARDAARARALEEHAKAPEPSHVGRPAATTRPPTFPRGAPAEGPARQPPVEALPESAPPPDGAPAAPPPPPDAVAIVAVAPSALVPTAPQLPPVPELPSAGTDLVSTLPVAVPTIP